MKTFTTIFSSLFLRIFPASFSRLFIKPPDIVWIVHPRDSNDLLKKLTFLKSLSESVILSFSKILWPFIVSKFSLPNNQSINGYVIGIPLSTEQIVADPLLASQKVRQALILAQKIGAKNLSLGGFITSIVKKNKLGQNLNLNIFDGTTLLSRLVAEQVTSLAKNTENMKNLSVGIIGATTEVGSSLASLVSQLGLKRLYLFGKTLEHLQSLGNNLGVNSKCRIIISTNLKELENCDINVLTAYLSPDNSAEIENYIKPASFFVGAVEPVSPFIKILADKRKDVRIIPGIRIKTPGMEYHGYDFGLPIGDSYVCLTEAIVFSRYDNKLADVLQSDLKKSIRATQKVLSENNFKPLWLKNL